jgi:hypothetical protein
MEICPKFEDETKTGFYYINPKPEPIGARAFD